MILLKSAHEVNPTKHFYASIEKYSITRCLRGDISIHDKISILVNMTSTIVNFNITLRMLRDIATKKENLSTCYLI